MVARGPGICIFTKLPQIMFITGRFRNLCSVIIPFKAVVLTSPAPGKHQFPLPEILLSLVCSGDDHLFPKLPRRVQGTGTLRTTGLKAFKAESEEMMNV